MSFRTEVSAVESIEVVALVPESKSGLEGG